MWDLERLWEETVRGLREAMALFPDAVSVSVDTWGVDFVPLDEDDRVVGEPRAYRDERTARTLEDFRSLVDGYVLQMEQAAERLLPHLLPRGRR